ncbi:hypothetical protein SK53_04398 [Enterobacter sp. MGH119]|jgi:hypothetical protein|nr:hypothetical protein SK53_04398 [Enterobacter sp. MGH119]
MPYEMPFSENNGSPLSPIAIPAFMFYPELP